MKLNQRDFFRDTVHPYFKSIENSALKILRLPVNGKPFNPFAFTNYKLKQGKHPGSVDEALKALIKANDVIKNSWAYCNKIVDAKSGMWYERYNIGKHEKLKQEFKDFIDNSERIQELVSGIGINVW